MAKKKSVKTKKAAVRSSKKTAARVGGGISSLLNRSKPEAEWKPSSGDLRSKIRSKHGLAPGFDGVVKSGGAVMHIRVDAKGREEILSTYIPE